MSSTKTESVENPVQSASYILIWCKDSFGLIVQSFKHILDILFFLLLGLLAEVSGDHDVLSISAADYRMALGFGELKVRLWHNPDIQCLSWVFIVCRSEGLGIFRGQEGVSASIIVADCLCVPGSSAFLFCRIGCFSDIVPSQKLRLPGPVCYRCFHGHFLGPLSPFFGPGGVIKDICNLGLLFS